MDNRVDNSNEYITVEEAKKELGENAFYSFNAWLRKKGYQNLTAESETKLVNKIFATKEQLKEFNIETGQNSEGDVKTLFGQTREYFRGER